MRGAFEVVGVLVEAHCFCLLGWSAGQVRLVVLEGPFGDGARLVAVFDRCCYGIWLSG